MLRREVLPSGEVSVNLAVNLRRLIWNAKERFQCNNKRSGPTGTLRGCRRIMQRRSAAFLLNPKSVVHESEQQEVDV